MTRITISALFALNLVASAVVVQAAEWQIDPAINMRMGYNDNIRLTPTDKIDSTEFTLSPSVLFGVRTPRSDVDGTLHFDFRRYPMVTGLNDNNARVDVNSHYKFEQSQLGLQLHLIQDTTLDSQLEQTGIVFDRSNRIAKGFTPSWTWLFNERTSIEADYSYENVNYESKNPGLSDYDAKTGQLSLVNVLSERTSARITLAHTLTSNDAGIDSSYTSLQAGATHSFSETLSGSLFAGVRRSEARYPQPVPLFYGPFFLGYVDTGQKTADVEWGSVFSASIDKRFERAETSLAASRDISTSFSGIPFTVTRLDWNNRYGFSETLSGNLGLTWYDSESTNKRSTVNSRYWTIRPELNWDFTQFWRLSASYRYDHQKYRSSSADAVQNSAYLTLTYRWPRIAISR